MPWWLFGMPLLLLVGGIALAWQIVVAVRRARAVKDAAAEIASLVGEERLVWLGTDPSVEATRAAVRRITGLRRVSGDDPWQIVEDANARLEGKLREAMVQVVFDGERAGVALAGVQVAFALEAAALLHPESVRATAGEARLEAPLALDGWVLPAGTVVGFGTEGPLPVSARLLAPMQIGELAFPEETEVCIDEDGRVVGFEARDDVRTPDGVIAAGDIAIYANGRWRTER